MIDEVKKEMENFLYNVKWLRHRHGLSKKRMAELLGIGLWSLNKIENGEMPPKLDIGIIVQIKNHFGIYPKEQFESRLED